jgi:DnaK suppressor protein
LVRNGAFAIFVLDLEKGIMTAKEREEVRKRIEGEIETLEKSIATLEALTAPDVQSDANDWFTSKESNPSKSINEQALVKSRQRISILRGILTRIDSPEFGICHVCKKPIQIERIKAMPTATRCISC